MSSPAVIKRWIITQSEFGGYDIKGDTTSTLTGLIMSVSDAGEGKFVVELKTTSVTLMVSEMDGYYRKDKGRREAQMALLELAAAFNHEADAKTDMWRALHEKGSVTRVVVPLTDLQMEALKATKIRDEARKAYARTTTNRTYW